MSRVVTPGLSVVAGEGIVFRFGLCFYQDVGLLGVNVMWR